MQGHQTLPVCKVSDLYLSQFLRSEEKEKQQQKTKTKMKIDFAISPMLVVQL